MSTLLKERIFKAESSEWAFFVETLASIGSDGNLSTISIMWLRVDWFKFFLMRGVSFVQHAKAGWVVLSWLAFLRLYCSTICFSCSREWVCMLCFAKLFWYQLTDEIQRVLWIGGANSRFYKTGALVILKFWYFMRVCDTGFHFISSYVMQFCMACQFRSVPKDIFPVRRLIMYLTRVCT